MAQDFNSILTNEEKKEIYEMLINIFGEETEKTFSLKQYIYELEQLIDEMNLEEKKVVAHFNNKTISYMRYNMDKMVARRNILAAKGYMLIFKLREYLLNEKLNYRYYFIDENTGNVNIRNFSELQLLDFMTFEENRIGLNSAKLIESEDLKERSSFEKMVNQQIQKYTNPDNNLYMTTVGYLNLRRVRKSIKMKYKTNRGLGLASDQRKYQVFNMGHIFESVDLTLTYWLMNQDKNLNIDDLMFGQFLRRDSVVASKGGDNFLTNTSIKFGKASIYSYNTISNQLKQIQFMLKSKDASFINYQIKKLFLDDSEKSEILSKDLEQASQTATNKILDQILSNLTK